LAREQLNELLERFTDINPMVQAQRAKVAALERAGTLKSKIVPARNTGGTNAPAVASRTAASAELFSGQLQSLETARLGFSERRRTFELLEESPPGYFQILKPATAQTSSRGAKI
jgi:hypothetical protein